jgi:hypothetical protein
MSRALIFAAAITFAGPARADTAYFAEIEDVPLPPGFTEVVEPSPFESGGGRIVFVGAEGRGPAAQVRAFYSDSLPQLGWAFSPGQDGALVFQRGRETLSVIVGEGAQRTHLSVRLVTRPQTTNAD